MLLLKEMSAVPFSQKNIVLFYYGFLLVALRCCQSNKHQNLSAILLYLILRQEDNNNARGHNICLDMAAITELKREIEPEVIGIVKQMPGIGFGNWLREWEFKCLELSDPNRPLRNAEKLMSVLNEQFGLKRQRLSNYLRVLHHILLDLKL